MSVLKKSLDDQEKGAMMEYRLIQKNNMAVPQPNFVSFTNNILFLSEQSINKV